MNEERRSGCSNPPPFEDDLQARDSSTSASSPLLGDSDSRVSLLKQLNVMRPEVYHRYYFPCERRKMERYESVDTYEPATTVYKDHLENRSQEPRWFIWVFVFVLGMASSAIAMTIVSVLHMLNGIRYELLGFGLRGFNFSDSNRYDPQILTNHTELDIVSMFEGLGVGLYGIEPRSFSKGYLMWISFSVVMSLLSSIICALVPESAGSGLPEVMAYLNGVDYPMLGSIRVLLAKVGSIVFSVASGVCTGHFGTLFLTGAMLGAQALQRRSFFRCDCVNIIDCFRNPRDRRIIVVIGAAAGVASAFSVSIGGLLVVVELISTILPVRFALYVFAASLVSSLTLQCYFSFFQYFTLRDRRFYPSGELISPIVQLFTSNVSFENIVRMHIFYFIPAIVIGLLCGVLAGGYTRLSWLALILRRRLELRLHTKIIRYIMPVLFTFVYVTIHYWVAAAFGSGGWSPQSQQEQQIKEGNNERQQQENFLPLFNNTKHELFVHHHQQQQQQLLKTENPSMYFISELKMDWPCVAIPSTLLTTKNVSVIAYYGVNGFFCNSIKHMNDNYTKMLRGENNQAMTVLHSYASLAFAYADSAIQTLLSWRTEEMLWVPVLCVFLLIYFISSALFLGVALCSDTIMPGFVIGATIGRLFGLAVLSAEMSLRGDKTIIRSSWADPGSFALIGAGSFVGGTTGLTFSICVILMESTGDIQHILPLMMGITIAKKTAELFTHNINDILLEARCIPMLNFENQIHKYPMFDARHVMIRNVVILETVCTIERVLDVLRSSHHNGFPIESVRDRTYKGIILRKQLEILLWHIYFTNGSTSICTYEIGKKVEARLFYDKLLGTLPSLDMYLRIRIDLSPYIDQSGFCILDTTTLPRTYNMFRTLGLRHLTVVNQKNRIVGIITRKDLVADRIIDVITAVDEKRRLMMKARYYGNFHITEEKEEKEKEKEEQEQSLLPSSTSTTTIRVSVVETRRENDGLNRSEHIQETQPLDYDSYRLGEWIVMENHHGDWDNDRVIREGRMHLSESQVNLIRLRESNERSTLLLLSETRHNSHDLREGGLLNEEDQTTQGTPIVTNPQEDDKR
ncbi:chloride channel protein [Trypanosoma theileri]|uniref:Chloride channel protein n=1 Tax=Trypanosoma theileri TaxID=67003 RepID=A0A1X0P0Y6_9TRYP|nr:chloride channel protein [Trypanosoma theileri]ORC90562.1 chloride channel protein [Trypanosoma theileri]